MVPYPDFDAGSKITTRSINNVDRDRPWRNPQALSADMVFDSQMRTSGTKSSRMPKAKDVHWEDPNMVEEAEENSQGPQLEEAEPPLTDFESVLNDPAVHINETFPQPDTYEQSEMLVHAEKFVRDIFGRWTNEHNARESAKMAIVREVIVEELNAHGYHLHGENGRNTAAKIDLYAKFDDLKELEDEI